MKLTDGDDAAAEARLASEMLCLEHSARAYGPGLEPLDLPHEPWPLVKLPPLTADGEEVRVHYRPVVGYVYLAREERFDVSAFADRVGALLHAKGSAHLLNGHKAVGVAGAMVARKNERRGEPGPAPPRLWPPPLEEEKAATFRPRAFYRHQRDSPPGRCDSWAGFTWHFVEAVSGVAWSGSGMEVMSDETRSRCANALVAGVVYDRLDVFRVADGDSVMGPQMALRAGTSQPDYFEKLRPLLCADRRGLFLLRGGGVRGRLVLVGDRRAVGEGETAAWFEGLHAEPWPPRDLVDPLPRFPAAGSIECMRCRILVSGRFAVIRRAVVPAKKDWHDGIMPMHLKASEPLLDPEKGFVLCRTCAQASAECLIRHMKAVITRSEAPWDQAQAFSASDALGALVPLLRAGAWTEPDAAGVVMVDMGKGATIVLAGARLGRRAELTHEFLAKRRLPVLDMVYLGVASPDLLER